uniref:Uncharacterized protein n=1 Tax=Aegilops tauschii subsp. strangulata TaxID=200361 RepID=A0A452YV50_AEGTS
MAVSVHFVTRCYSALSTVVLLLRFEVLLDVVKTSQLNPVVQTQIRRSQAYGP